MDMWYWRHRTGGPTLASGLLHTLRNRKAAPKTAPPNIVLVYAVVEISVFVVVNRRVAKR